MAPHQLCSSLLRPALTTTALLPFRALNFLISPAALGPACPCSPPPLPSLQVVGDAGVQDIGDTSYLIATRVQQTEPIRGIITREQGEKFAGWLLCPGRLG